MLTPFRSVIDFSFFCSSPGSLSSGISRSPRNTPQAPRRGPRAGRSSFSGAPPSHVPVPTGPIFPHSGIAPKHIGLITMSSGPSPSYQAATKSRNSAEPRNSAKPGSSIIAGTVHVALRAIDLVVAVGRRTRLGDPAACLAQDRDPGAVDEVGDDDEFVLPQVFQALLCGSGCGKLGLRVGERRGPIRCPPLVIVLHSFSFLLFPGRSPSWAYRHPTQRKMDAPTRISTQEGGGVRGGGTATRTRSGGGSARRCRGTRVPDA